MQRSTFISGLALAAALFAAPVAGSAQQAIRLGTTPEAYPPFTWIEPDGTVKGFEVDLADAICAEMKVKCSWVLQAWDGIIPALQNGTFDAIVASMSITAKRKEVVDFSDRYYNTPAAIVGRKDEAITITPEGLKGKTIGVQVSTIHDGYVAAKFKDLVTVKQYDTQENANLDLIAGRVDLLMADIIALKSGLLDTKDGADFEVKGQPITDPLLGDGVGFAVRKGDPLREKFSAAIAAIRADGRYDAIAKKYFDFDVYGTES